MVTLEDFENAKDKVMMGSEEESMVMTEDEKKLTAYHEAGHAVQHSLQLLTLFIKPQLYHAVELLEWL